MEKNGRKTKKSSIIIFIVYLLIIGTLSCLTYNNYKEYKELNKKNIIWKENNKKLNVEYTEKIKETETLKEDIKKYDDIDKTIENTKKEVFDLAKKVEEKITKKETNYKIAYITFDDGPYELTDNVLEVLKQKKVKATFFTIGAGKTSCIDNRSKDCTETYKKIVDNGHTIANHTYSHAIFNGLYSSSNNFINDISKQEDLIYSKTGIKTNIMRFPGGSSTAKNIKDEIIQKLRDKGYGWVDWTAEDGDGKYIASNEQAWNTFTRTVNDDIEVILFHDYNRITYSILPDAIDYLEKNNYIILPLFYESKMINK